MGAACFGLLALAVIPDLRAMGYSRGGLVEPACGKSHCSHPFRYPSFDRVSGKMDRISSKSPVENQAHGLFPGCQAPAVPGKLLLRD